ncbi:hypothetical protein [Paraburkholderia fungorum]|jgi:predicted house-cleaning noncanonical NTP pyrophosphatase (MazG superfamily)|uniref:hypothetical protein n=1 Tax=Paraburkholderia fungorum TaxID=134537 RepID=UPI000D05FBC4|nr:hypothetical protein [Paraburkholderia fungorum]PRZ48163.1 hypothetical protein BX589_128119 [Paraburkholderia fungorum]
MEPRLRASRPSHFIINGEKILFGGRTLVAAYQVVLDNFKADKSVKEFINPEYLEDSANLLDIIHRLELATGHKIKPEQLKEYGYDTREELDKAGEKYDARLAAVARPMARNPTE